MRPDKESRYNQVLAAAVGFNFGVLSLISADIAVNSAIRGNDLNLFHAAHRSVRPSKELVSKWAKPYELAHEKFNCTPGTSYESTIAYFYDPRQLGKLMNPGKNPISRADMEFDNILLAKVSAESGEVTNTATRLKMVEVSGFRLTRQEQTYLMIKAFEKSSQNLQNLAKTEVSNLNITQATIRIAESVCAQRNADSLKTTIDPTHP